MTLLIIGIIVFLGLHLLPTVSGLRDRLVSRFGQNGYRVLFSLLSIAGFVLLVYGFAKAADQPIAQARNGRQQVNAEKDDDADDEQCHGFRLTLRAPLNR